MDKHFATIPSDGNRNIVGNEAVWTFIFGVIAFVLVQVFHKYETPSSGSVVRQLDDGYMYTWPLIGGVSSMLLLLIVANLFGTKNDKGKFQLSDKHLWVRAFGFVVGGMLFFFFGWLLALCIALWMSTLRT